MGMSASQARFLSLTARKANVEYEGQQINQQRTALSNESSNYYSQLTSLAVPVPASSADYTKITYTFKDGNENNTVTSLVATTDTKNTGVYMLNYSQEIPTETMVVSGTNIISKTGDKYYVGKYELQSSSSVYIDISVVEIPISETKNEIRYLTQERGKTAIADYMVVTDGKPDRSKYFIRKQDVVDDNAKTKTEDGIKYYYVPSLGGWVSPTTNDITKGEYNKDAQGNDTSLIIETNVQGFILDNEKFNVDSKTGKYNIYEEISAAEAGIVNNDTRLSVVERFIAAGIPAEIANNYSNDELKSKLELETQYKALAEEKYGDRNWQVRYVKNPSTNSYEAVLYSLKELENADYNDRLGTSLSGLKQYVYGESTETKEIKNAYAKVEQDSSGRYISLFVYDEKPFDESGNFVDKSGRKYDLTTTTESDDAAYNDAMNQYYYDKAVYDQQIDSINDKIEIIQVQDKNLELKLKQLDTEQNAISTEMDAVKKVISKNVESSFKTFNA